MLASSPASECSSHQLATCGRKLLIAFLAMGNYQVIDRFPSQAVPLKYKFEGEELSAQDLDLKKVEFDAQPFDCGRFRQAFRGKVYLGQNPPTSNGERERHSDRIKLDRLLRCWDLRKDRPFYPCIVKTFKYSDAKNAAAWENDLQVLDKARSLAERFNRDVKPPVEVNFAGAFLYQVFEVGQNQTKEVYFPRALARRLLGDKTALLGRQPQQKPCKSVISQERVCVEPELEGEFVKANCNNGYVKAGGEHLGVAQAFSHWTWWVTKGELLVCDLQGVVGDFGWRFTDPAIHCAAGRRRFGATDLGPRGINAFFSTHACNSMCEKWGKPDTVVDLGMPVAAAHTTYSFEMVSSEVHSQEDFADILDHANTGTCYAQAAATMIRAAERRIVGRNLERHHVIAQRLVTQFGTKGIPTLRLIGMLEQECEPRCLRVRRINSSAAISVVEHGRAILVDFHLDKAQWDCLSHFFSRSPSGVLNELPDRDGSEVSGHAAILIGFAEGAWKVKNSWGDDFADGGYFRISKQLLEKARANFIDVFFYEEELRPADKKAYIEYCRESKLLTCSS